jgi:pyruvate formate lyase activating enzyme
MIGGLVPCSFIDFPGCLSAVVFLRGCNLRCPYCHNPELLDGDAPGAMTEDGLLAFLRARQGRLGGVVFSGGEPTLRPGLRSLVQGARALGFKVKLDTNGTRPDVLAELIGDGLVDYVALDLKDEPAGYTGWLRMREAPALLLRSLDLVKASGVDHELRTTVTIPRHDAGRLDSMADVARGARRWVLQPYRPGATLASDPPMAAPDREQLMREARRIQSTHGIDCSCRCGAAWPQALQPIRNDPLKDA